MWVTLGHPSALQVVLEPEVRSHPDPSQRPGAHQSVDRLGGHRAEDHEHRSCQGEVKATSRTRLDRDSPRWFTVTKAAPPGRGQRSSNAHEHDPRSQFSGTANPRPDPTVQPRVEAFIVEQYAAGRTLRQPAAAWPDIGPSPESSFPSPTPSRRSHRPFRRPLEVRSRRSPGKAEASSFLGGGCRNLIRRHRPAGREPGGPHALERGRFRMCA
jgi:hypothetical protein